MNDLPNIQGDCFKAIEQTDLHVASHSTHPPEFLLLYGSLREHSFSRLVMGECERILQAVVCETRVFNPSGLPS